MIQARVSEPPPLEAMYWALKMTPAAGAMWVIDWNNWPGETNRASRESGLLGRGRH